MALVVEGFGEGAEVYARDPVRLGGVAGDDLAVEADDLEAGLGLGIVAGGEDRVVAGDNVADAGERGEDRARGAGRAATSSR
ncbi:MAG: hypothetical protein FJX75_08370 [Armatimonadetes bacterium]|nr:hypothetical protein [Armatimonadota bacterium]